MSSPDRNCHELLSLCKSGLAPHIKNTTPGFDGHDRSNAWVPQGLSTLVQRRGCALGRHLTVGALAMMAVAIIDCSGPGDQIIDPLGLMAYIGPPDRLFRYQVTAGHEDAT